ncbi:MAG: hypothetical protein AAF565_02950 [Pseudomonadota bacterium]
MGPARRLLFVHEVEPGGAQELFEREGQDVLPEDVVTRFDRCLGIAPLDERLVDGIIGADQIAGDRLKGNAGPLTGAVELCTHGRNHLMFNAIR